MQLSIIDEISADIFGYIEPDSFKDEFAKNMNVQMRYMLPGIVFFVAYSISSAVALYWLVSNLFSIGHELVVKRKALLLAR